MSIDEHGLQTPTDGAEPNPDANSRVPNAGGVADLAGAQDPFASSESGPPDDPGSQADGAPRAGFDWRSLAKRALPWVLGALVVATSVVVAGVSVWLVPPYLVIVGLILFTPAKPREGEDEGEGEGKSQAPDDDASTPAPRSQRFQGWRARMSRAGKDLGDAEGSAPGATAADPGETELEVGPDPAGTSPDHLDAANPPTTGRRRRKRGQTEGEGGEAEPGSESPGGRGRRGRGKAMAMKPLAQSEATWVQVAPGKFVRVEGAVASATDSGPHDLADANRAPAAVPQANLVGDATALDAFTSASFDVDPSAPFAAGDRSLFDTIALGASAPLTDLPVPGGWNPGGTFPETPPTFDGPDGPPHPTASDEPVSDASDESESEAGPPPQPEAEADVASALLLDATSSVLDGAPDAPPSPVEPSSDPGAVVTDEPPIPENEAIAPANDADDAATEAMEPEDDSAQDEEQEEDNDDSEPDSDEGDGESEVEDATEEVEEASEEGEDDEDTEDEAEDDAEDEAEENDADPEEGEETDDEEPEPSEEPGDQAEEEEDGAEIDDAEDEPGEEDDSPEAENEDEGDEDDRDDEEDESEWDESGEEEDSVEEGDGEIAEEGETDVASSSPDDEAEPENAADRQNEANASLEPTSPDTDEDADKDDIAEPEPEPEPEPSQDVAPIPGASSWDDRTQPEDAEARGVGYTISAEALGFAEPESPPLSLAPEPVLAEALSNIGGTAWDELTPNLLAEHLPPNPSTPVEPQQEIEASELESEIEPETETKTFEDVEDTSEGSEDSPDEDIEGTEETEDDQDSPDADDDEEPAVEAEDTEEEEEEEEETEEEETEEEETEEETEEEEEPEEETAEESEDHAEEEFGEEEEADGELEEGSADEESGEYAEEEEELVEYVDAPVSAVSATRLRARLWGRSGAAFRVDPPQGRIGSGPQPRYPGRRPTNRPVKPAATSPARSRDRRRSR